MKHILAFMLLLAILCGCTSGNGQGKNTPESTVQVTTVAETEAPTTKATEIETTTPEQSVSATTSVAETLPIASSLPPATIAPAPQPVETQPQFAPIPEETYRENETPIG